MDKGFTITCKRCGSKNVEFREHIAHGEIAGYELWCQDCRDADLNVAGIISMQKPHVGFLVDRTDLINEKIDRHKEIVDRMHEMYQAKNHDYNDAYATARTMIPGYGIGRLCEKFERILTLWKHPDQTKVNETIEDNLLDLANYVIIEYIEREREVSRENRKG